MEQILKPPEGIEVNSTPYRFPKADAVAERWIRPLREECQNLLLIINPTSPKTKRCNNEAYSKQKSSIYPGWR